MARRGGFSLIEVLIATAILAVGLLAVFASMSPALSVYSAARRMQDVQWILALAELKHPVVGFDELEDLVVEKDDDLAMEGEKLGEGFVFSRAIDEKIIEEDDDDDGIYVMRSKISWGSADGESEEIVQLKYAPDAGGYEP